MQEAFAAGFASGLAFALVLVLIALVVVAGVAWRWARAVERSGINISLPPDNTGR